MRGKEKPERKLELKKREELESNWKLKFCWEIRFEINYFSFA